MALQRLLALDYVITLAADRRREGGGVHGRRGAEGHVAGPVYAGTDGSHRRHFVHRLPLAFDAERATFVFVQPEEETQSGLRTWAGQHAGLWAALLAAGRAVEVAVAGRNAERLIAQVRRDEEIASIRTAIATLDNAALAAYGGLNEAIARCAALRNGRDRGQSG